MKQSPLETEVLELLADHDHTCFELLDSTDADEDALAVAMWNLVRAGKVKFAFDHWEAT